MLSALLHKLKDSNGAVFGRVLLSDSSPLTRLLPILWHILSSREVPLNRP